MSVSFFLVSPFTLVAEGRLQSSPRVGRSGLGTSLTKPAAPRSMPVGGTAEILWGNWAKYSPKQA
ncbi:MAG: hypothetical protein NZ602_06910 [Thermoguttaceae bacterium]|nr:hypothetical protein [Thermoguttaceae bacterium]